MNGWLVLAMVCAVFVVGAAWGYFQACEDHFRMPNQSNESRHNG